MCQQGYNQLHIKNYLSINFYHLFHSTLCKMKVCEEISYERKNEKRKKSENHDIDYNEQQ